jgi:hypothetical protein
VSTGSFGDENTLDRTFCAQGFNYWMNTDENGQLSIIPRGSQRGRYSSRGTARPLLNRFVKLAMLTIMVSSTN